MAQFFGIIIGLQSDSIVLQTVLFFLWGVTPPHSPAFTPLMLGVAKLKDVPGDFYVWGGLKSFCQNSSHL